MGEDGKTILYDSRATKVYGLRASQEAHDLLRVVPGCEYPLCPKSGDPARPNILMFMDGAFSSARADSQEEAYYAWAETLPADASVVVLEVGVGTVIPKIRAKAELAAQSYDRSTLIRINVDWAANKSFEISKFKLKFPRARTFFFFARRRLKRRSEKSSNFRTF